MKGMILFMCEILYNLHYYFIAFIILIILIISICTILYKVNIFNKKILSALSGFLTVFGFGKWIGKNALNKDLNISGYAYDPNQDIFYSNINPWQKRFGYCRLYDEAAAPLGMIVDSEPIHFIYNNKRWLIEFWKGQYDLSTGCEVGIYTSKNTELSIPGIFFGYFYEAANESEFLNIECKLIKNDRVLFKREGKHWWLTGFKVGEFSEPSELTMGVKIGFPNKQMCEAFINGLENAGYKEDEYIVHNTSVMLVFSDPHTKQPVTRTDVTDKIIQRKNKLMCEKFNELTKGSLTIKEKYEIIRKKDPTLFAKAMGIGRPKQLYNGFKYLKNRIIRP